MEVAGNSNYTPPASEIEGLKNEVLCFTMASHLFWTLWSFVNVHQDIEFGYWVSEHWLKSMCFFCFNFVSIINCFFWFQQSYGKLRSAAYFAAKEAYLKTKGIDVKRTHVLDDRKWNENTHTHKKKWLATNDDNTTIRSKLHSFFITSKLKIDRKRGSEVIERRIEEMQWEKKERRKFVVKSISTMKIPMKIIKLKSYNTIQLSCNMRHKQAKIYHVPNHPKCVFVISRAHLFVFISPNGLTPLS